MRDLARVPVEESNVLLVIQTSIANGMPLNIILAVAPDPDPCPGQHRWLRGLGCHQHSQRVMRQGHAVDSVLLTLCKRRRFARAGVDEEERAAVTCDGEGRLAPVEVERIDAFPLRGPWTDRRTRLVGKGGRSKGKRTRIHNKHMLVRADHNTIDAFTISTPICSRFAILSPVYSFL